jgi:hypothetical protein
LGGGIPGFELRVYTMSQLHLSFSVMGFFKIGSRKLFAQGWHIEIIKAIKKLKGRDGPNNVCTYE